MINFSQFRLNIDKKVLNQNASQFFKFSMELLESIDDSKLDERSTVEINAEFIVIDLIHKDGLSHIRIRVDKAEVYVWIDDIGYTMFHISIRDGSLFYEDISKFLENALRGNYIRKSFFRKEQLFMVGIFWNNDIYREKIEIGLLDLFKYKLGFLKPDLVTEKNFSSFL